MFHAFLKKAEASNNTFEDILSSAQNVALEEEPPDHDVDEQYTEINEDELEYMIDEAFKSEKGDEELEQKTITHQMVVADESNQEHSERDGNDYNESKWFKRFGIDIQSPKTNCIQCVCFYFR